MLSKSVESVEDSETGLIITEIEDVDDVDSGCDGGGVADAVGCCCGSGDPPVEDEDDSVDAVDSVELLDVATKCGDMCCNIIILYKGFPILRVTLCNLVLNISTVGSLFFTCHWLPPTKLADNTKLVQHFYLVSKSLSTGLS